MKKKILNVLMVLIVFIAFFTTISVDWLYSSFGNISMDEIVFHLKVPLEGSNTDMVGVYFKECTWQIVMPSLLISLWLLYFTINSEKRRTMVICFSISIILLIASIIRIFITTDVGEYVYNQFDTSTLIEDEYVDPSTAKVEFPEQKRNLIYIFLESMEKTYTSIENGGLSTNDLIPELSKLAKENEDFSNTNEIGGAHVLEGTSWTSGAMTAQTTGVPLKLKIDVNTLGNHTSFVGGAYSIGQILEENGYKNFLLIGSEAKFGGREALFTEHGNYEISDYWTARKNQKINKGEWWGYTDNKLFEFAKEELLKLAETGQPFNFTTLTTDTHFLDGWKCEDCREQWGEQYKNVMSCSSRRVAEFINWIKQQDFYENTTIVISGDHLTMQEGFFAIEEDSTYEKKVISMIINSPVEAGEETREFSTFDLYPTTLAALGAKIEGNKLALGTNLFSNEMTLIEKYGVEYVNNELKKTSKFYDNNILVSK